MSKVFVTRRIPEEALQVLRDAPEVAEVRVNPENRVLTRQGAFYFAPVSVFRCSVFLRITILQFYERAF